MADDGFAKMKDVVFRPLRQIDDERGKIMHMIRSDQVPFESFGEVYFSWINPGYIKGWTTHKVMTVNLAVLVGRVRIVVCDDSGRTKEFLSGSDEYGLLSIPPGYWYGFQCISAESALIANCASHPHDPDEMTKRSIDDFSILYKWPDI